MRLLLAAFLICLPAMGMAKSIIVRSGDHADFSRLTFDFNESVGWKMGRVPQGYEIRLNQTDAELDISGVYRRISHERIKDIEISQDSSRIVLALGCECHADAFEFRPGLLVIDVKEGSPPNGSAFETTFTSDEISATQPVDSVPPEQGVVQHESIETSLTDERKHLPVLTQSSRRQFRPKVEEGVDSDPADVDIVAPVRTPPSPKRRIADMQLDLLNQIGRAASQGLLEADILPTSNVVSDSESANIPSVAIAKVDEMPNGLALANIHIESSVDREIIQPDSANTLAANGTSCLPQDLFNVRDWGDPDSIMSQVVVQRGKLVGEFDRVNEAAVKALAKAYIHAGFGAEALAVLKAFDGSLENAGILKVMARVVDGQTIPDVIEFEGQEGCESAVTLWLALAAPQLSDSVMVNRNATLGEFFNLPRHLRRHLGPGLAQKFLDIGDTKTARAIRNSVARSTVEPGSELRMLDAQFDHERGLHEASEQALENIVSEDNAIAPIALIRLLREKLERKSEVDEKLTATAQAFIFQQQGTQLAADLSEVVALIKAQSGDLPAALAILKDLDGSEYIDDKESGDTWGKVLESAVASPEDEDFIRFIFAAHDDLGRHSIKREIRQKTAERILKMGFPEMAQSILLPPSSPTEDDIVLMAEVAINMGQTARALDILKPISGDRAARLRARAFELEGDYENAAHEYAVLSDQESQRNILLRAGQWGRMSEIAFDPERDAALAKILQNDSDIGGDLPQEDVIAEDQYLLESSRMSRQSIDVFLKEYSFEPRDDL